MRVACVGGGPAGLFLALLLRRAGDHVVDVFDRNPAGSSHGFGVVFSRLTLGRLRLVAPDVVDAVTARGVGWDDVVVRAGGTSVRSAGNGYAAVERRAMLGVLRGFAERAGARVYPGRTVEAGDLLDRYDVVVGADGSASRTRGQRADHFGARVSHGATRYAWFAVDRPADAMTFVFADGPHGIMCAHMYPSSARTSTFIVETTTRTWRAAGFGDDGELPVRGTDERALAYCQEVFAAELAGARLLGNGSRWLSFPQVCARRWSYGRLVLVGDAAHTAHFSVGSGTSMAMEDSAELANQLARCAGGDGDVEAALARYESARRAPVASLQQAAWASSQLWEWISDADLAPGPLLLRLLTRSGQATTDLLLRADPRLPETTGRSLSTHPPPDEVVTVGTLCEPPSPRAGRTALLLTASEAAAGFVGTGETVVVEFDQTGASDPDLPRTLRALRASTSVGVVVTVPDTMDGAACNRLLEALAALHLATPLDVVAVARGAGRTAGLRVTQMTVCDQIRRELGVHTAYLSPAADLRHGWTHVQAGRADTLWTMSGNGCRSG